jgi:hypothetical protein
MSESTGEHELTSHAAQQSVAADRLRRPLNLFVKRPRQLRVILSLILIPTARADRDTPSRTELLTKEDL